LWVHHVTPKTPKPCTPSEYWKNLAHLLGIVKTWQNQNLACLLSYWQKLAKKNPPLHTIGKTCQNQNQAFRVLAKPGMPSQYGQNQHHPFPFLGKFGRTKTWHAFWVLEKPSKTKTCIPSKCWQNQNLVHLPNIGKTSQNQNLAHLSTICKTQRYQNLVCLSGCGKTWQNQKSPLPSIVKTSQNLHLLRFGKTWKTKTYQTFLVLAKPTKTKTWFGFQAIGKTR
jgi:hypothetical protein